MICFKITFLDTTRKKKKRAGGRLDFNIHIKKHDQILRNRYKLSPAGKYRS